MALPMIGLPGWEGIALLAAFISFLIVSLFYMFALVLNLPALKAWCKSEYMQVIASIVLIGLIYLIVEVGMTAASQFTFSAIVNSTSSNYLINPDSETLQPITDPTTGQPIDIRNPDNPITTNHFTIAHLYLKRAIRCEQDLYLVFYKINSYVEFAEKFSVGNAGVEPVAGWPLSGFVSLMHYFTNSLGYAIFAQYIQFHLLKFAESTMLTLFLPLGIILRSFPIFRGAGGFIIAIAMGMYFVFPLCLVMLAAVQGDINSSCAVAPPGLTAKFEETCNSVPSDGIIHVQNVKNFFEAGGWMDIGGMKPKVLMAITQAIFFPLVAFVITFTFVRATSAMFGSDLAEIGRGIMKLI